MGSCRQQNTDSCRNTWVEETSVYITTAPQVPRSVGISSEQKPALHGESLYRTRENGNLYSRTVRGIRRWLIGDRLSEVGLRADVLGKVRLGYGRLSFKSLGDVSRVVTCPNFWNFLTFPEQLRSCFSVARPPSSEKYLRIPAPLSVGAASRSQPKDSF